MSASTLTFEITPADADRLDKFLVSQLPQFSRSRLQGLIKDGFVTVDGIPATKAGADLGPGAWSLAVAYSSFSSRSVAWMSSRSIMPSFA